MSALAMESGVLSMTFSSTGVGRLSKPWAETEIEARKAIKRQKIVSYSTYLLVFACKDNNFIRNKEQSMRIFIIFAPKR
jgi:hypothetical protein